LASVLVAAVNFSCKFSLVDDDAQSLTMADNEDQNQVCHMSV